MIDLVGDTHVDVGEQVDDDVTHDESLGSEPIRPRMVVRPGTAQEVAAIVQVAAAERVPLTARGSGTGLSGAPHPGGRRGSWSPSNGCAASSRSTRPTMSPWSSRG